MRFVQDNNLWLQLGDFVAHVFGLGEFVVAVDKYVTFDPSPLLELSLPVDLGDGRADDNDFRKAEKITGRNDLDCFSQPLFIC